MAQDLRKIERMYDTVAPEWAAAFAREHDRKPLDREMLQRFAQEIGDRRPVWEFGCGPGNTARFLKDLGLHISGLDLSAKLLEQARGLHPDIPFRKGNLLELDFASGSIAGVVAFYAIVHFSEDQVAAAFREVFRVLRPGGVFLCAWHIGEEKIHVNEFLGKEVDIDFMFFPAGFISGCLEKSGFEGIEILEREPYEGVEYQSRRAYGWGRKGTLQR